MRLGIQAKLTLSHLFVTILSILILAFLIAGGYLLYLQTNLPALWVASNADYVSEELHYLAMDEPLSSQNVRDFIANSGLVPIFDEMAPDEAISFFEDWLIVFDAQGKVLASNDEIRFTPGETIQQLPGYTFEDLQPAVYQYNVVGDDHIGLVDIVDTQDNTVGWVYLRSADIDAPLDSQQTLLALGGGVLLAALIAMIVSGIASGFLALPFVRRLRRLQAASLALAEGQLDQRVPPQGSDEIGQLGSQFNEMADRLVDQLMVTRQLAERNALLAEEASAFAALEERNRMARELHDALKQQVFGLSLTAGAIRQLAEEDVEQAKQRLAEMEQQARQLHEEVDAIIHQMRPASLEGQGISKALSALLDQWQTQNNVEVDFTIQGQGHLPLPIEHALLRIAQEALNNIERHSDASKVQIQLSYLQEEVELIISDDGQGFDAGETVSNTHLGLYSMYSRTKELGGEVEIKSEPGSGTKITVKMPITSEGNADG